MSSNYFNYIFLDAIEHLWVLAVPPLIMYLIYFSIMLGSFISIFRNIKDWKANEHLGVNKVHKPLLIVNVFLAVLFSFITRLFNVDLDLNLFSCALIIPPILNAILVQMKKRIFSNVIFYISVLVFVFQIVGVLYEMNHTEYGYEGD